MNIEKLAESLKPWMQVETWNTTHPLDAKRFNKAINSAINAHGCEITYDNFKEAMELLVEKLYSNKYEESYIEEIIDNFSLKAEIIVTYVSDTKQT